MKNLKSIIALLVFLIGGTIYVSQTYLDIDLLGYINPDVEEPVIDVSKIRTTITLDGVFDTSNITCEDNKDSECEIEIIGSIDTSVLGTQTITFQATDSSGNVATEVILVDVIEGIDTTMYVPLG